MAAGKERIEINTAVAVRGEIGFFFGSLRWIEPRRLLVEIDAELEAGEDVDVRITLAPTSHTALLNAVVARALVTAHGEIARYILDIVRIAADERALLDDWMQNIKNRGTFSRFDTVISAHRAGGDDPKANAEVRQALERLSRKGQGSSPSPATDPFGVRSDIVTGAELGAGRGAVRDALRSAIARGTAGRPATTPSTPPAPSTSPVPPRASETGAGWRGPESPSWSRSPESPSGARPAPPPRAPSHPPEEPYGARPGPGRVVAIGGTNPGFAAPSGTRPGLDPTYAVAATRTANWMEVKWQSPVNFDRDARLQLLNYILVLQRGKEPLPDKEPLRVMLRHAEVQLECAASIKAHGPETATYRLMLDALQIERIRQWTLDYGRK